MRTRLDSATATPTLPTARAWANGGYKPVAGTSYISDALELADTRPASLGQGGPRRTQALYTARVHVPKSTSSVNALTWAGAIAAAFLAPDLVVGSAPVDVTEARVESALGDEAWYIVPVSVFLWFDHA